MLEELKIKCRTQAEQIMAWKKAYSMQVCNVIEFFHSILSIHEMTQNTKKKKNYEGKINFIMKLFL